MKRDSVMTRRNTIRLAGLSAVAVVLSGCHMTSSSSFRYRMSVVGAHSGTAVYEILDEKKYGPLLPDEKPGGSIVKGEALTIETPSGPVFVLLIPAQGGGDLIGAITRALTPDIPWNGQPNFWKAVKRLARAKEGEVKGELSRADWPMMVRFGDINDPKTVERVSPDAIGVTQIALETTVAPVTTGIQNRLRWLPVIYLMLKGTDFAPEGIPVGDFEHLFSSDIH